MTAVDALRLVIAERAGGESRPQQQEMVKAVEAAIRDQTHLLVQAGTGTGKSVGYLIPAILYAVRMNRRVIVSTGTKSLSDQLGGIDLPLLQRLLPQVGALPAHSKPLFAVLKGKDNYACLDRINELVGLDARAPGGASAPPADAPAPDDDGLFGPVPVAAKGKAKKVLPDAPTFDPAARRPTANELKATRDLIKWVGDVDSPNDVTGDRSDLPSPVSDQQWQQVSVSAVDCKKKRCQFFEDCFAEKARKKAKEAHVVVTNHALVAKDITIPVAPLLGPWDVWICDEGHEAEGYLSSSWGASLSPTGLRNVSAEAANRLRQDDRGQATAKALVEDATALADLLEGMAPGRLDALPDALADLLGSVAGRLADTRRALGRSRDAAKDQQAADEHELTSDRIGGQEQTVAVLRRDSDDFVRWYETGPNGKIGTLNVAPLWIGPELIAGLGSGRTLIATSATLTVGGSFDPMVRSFGLELPVVDMGDENGDSTPVVREHRTLDVGTPFDYAKQAMVYVPNPRDFPPPDYQNRDQHAVAVQAFLAKAVRAAGGRTLALFTTTFAAQKAAEQLRKDVPQVRVFAQGDLPAGPLGREFAQDTTSVLCATMGFWAGLDVVGESLTLVVMDKLPFAPMNDPLTSARRLAADNAGRDGFHDIFVAGAATHMAQGAGRLIRAQTDRGVIAVLDTRLRTKGYGKPLMRSLPPGFLTDDQDLILKALERLTGGIPAGQPHAVQPVSSQPYNKFAGRRKGKARR